MWEGLESPSVNILFMTKLLSLNPLSWDMDCLLTWWPLLIPCSLGNGCCTFGFLIFITVKRNFLYKSLYILTERSLKHLCSIRASVPVSFFLSLSLSPSVRLSLSLSYHWHRTPRFWFIKGPWQDFNCIPAGFQTRRPRGISWVIVTNHWASYWVWQPFYGESCWAILRPRECTRMVSPGLPS